MKGVNLQHGEFGNVTIEPVLESQLIPGDVGRRVYVSLNPLEMDIRKDRGWTLQEIAKTALMNIPEDCPQERIRAIDLIHQLSNSEDSRKTLYAFGPDEGLYHLILTDEQPHEVLLGDIQ